MTYAKIRFKSIHSLMNILADSYLDIDEKKVVRNGNDNS